MNPSLEQISGLLAERSDNRQKDGYWESFLQEFHHSQQTASASSTWFGRLHSWYSEASTTKWIYGSGIVYAVAMIAFFLVPRGMEAETAPLMPVNYQVIPTSSHKHPENLSPVPANKGLSGDRLF